VIGLPPASRFPDAFLIQDDGRIELRFGGAGDTRTVEIPLWTLEGHDVEAAQLRLLVHSGTWATASRSTCRAGTHRRAARGEAALR
jgi:hypothetical protein